MYFFCSDLICIVGLRFSLAVKWNVSQSAVFACTLYNHSSRFIFSSRIGLLLLKHPLLPHNVAVHDGTTTAVASSLRCRTLSSFVFSVLFLFSKWRGDLPSKYRGIFLFTAVYLFKEQKRKCIHNDESLFLYERLFMCRLYLFNMYYAYVNCFFLKKGTWKDGCCSTCVLRYVKIQR